MPKYDAHNRTLKQEDQTPQVIAATTTLDDSYSNKTVYHLSMASAEALTLTLFPLACALIGVPYHFVCTVDGGGGATFVLQDRDDSIDSGQDIAITFKDKGDHVSLISNGSCWGVAVEDVTA